MRLRLLLGLCGGAIFLGCASLVGANDFTTIDPTADGGENAEASFDSPASDGGIDPLPDAQPEGPKCALPSTCMTAPPGFDGPFVVLEQGSSFTCAPAFTRAWERVGAGDASAPPATCTCSCGAFTGACNVTMTRYVTVSCAGVVGTQLMTVGVCYQGSAQGFRAVAAPTGSCPPNATTN